MRVPAQLVCLGNVFVQVLDIGKLDDKDSKGTSVDRENYELSITRINSVQMATRVLLP